MNNVRELRLKKGIQQKELALEVGVSNATVSDWEHGRKNPSGERLEKLAEFFGVSESVVLGKSNAFISDDPQTNGRTETEQIVQMVLEQLGDHPKTDEAKFISIAVDKMPPKDREKAMNVLKAIYGDYFTEDKIG